jgi:Flp pilus assembly pilin Flp
MRAALRQTTLDRRGETAIEYAMIALLISIVAFSLIVSIGTEVSGQFSRIAAGFGIG